MHRQTDAGGIEKPGRPTQLKPRGETPRDDAAQLRLIADNVPAMSIAYDENLRCLFPTFGQMTQPTYRITEAGRIAWESQDVAVPADYRFILWLIEFYGNAYARRLTGQYPSELVQEWLGEMEDLGLIVLATPSGGSGISTSPVSDPDRTLDLSKELQEMLYPKMRAASQALSRAGSYVAEDRLAVRRPLAKKPSDIEVLIVEDDPDQLALADLRVSMAGYTVRVADSVRALQKSLAEKGLPDLLLLDVMLPDGDGFDFLMKLRRHRSYSSLPVIMLTARRNFADIEQGFCLGADGYVTKPYSKNILDEVIRRVLKKQSS